MSRYDDIDPEEVRQQLVRVARLILRMNDEGRLLREAPRLQKLLGDLRQRLFAYEVRCTADLGSTEGAGEHEASQAEEEVDDPVLSESLRVVREALERQRELTEELEGNPPSSGDPDEEEG